MASRLKGKYVSEVVPALMARFGYRNGMQVPRLDKVVVNVGVGEAVSNSKGLDGAVRDVAAITGQRPIVNRARKSVAAFKLRTGMPIGVTATLRGERMYEFVDRLCNAVLPRVRDFRGGPTKSFDGRGNYTLGLREQLVFPEVDYDKIDKIRGLEVSIVTTAQTDEEARELLRLLGFPFARS